MYCTLCNKPPYPLFWKLRLEQHAGIIADQTALVSKPLELVVCDACAKSETFTLPQLRELAQ